VVDLDIAVILILILFIGAKKLGEVFEGLRILAFELLKPSVSLLRGYLLDIHATMKIETNISQYPSYKIFKIKL